jgi:Probable lipid transfer
MIVKYSLDNVHVFKLCSLNINNMDTKPNSIEPDRNKTISTNPINTFSLFNTNYNIKLLLLTRIQQTKNNMISFSSPKFTLIIVLLLCLMMSNGMVNCVIFCGLNDKGIKACLSAVRGSHPPPPTHTCCGYVTTADQKCFCQYRHSYLIRAFGINVEQVRKLPGICGIKLTVTC